MRKGGAGKRALLLAGVMMGALATIMAALTAITNDMYRHDRTAMRAFFTWRDNPTADNERRWQAARDAAMVRDLKFKGACFGVALLSGLATWRLYRAFRSSGSPKAG